VTAVRDFVVLSAKRRAASRILTVEDAGKFQPYEDRASASSRWCRYHSTVRSKPFVNGVVARNPNSAVAWDVSSWRRG
jgi:hypothetical protein